MKNISATLYLGKIDFCNRGRKDCTVEIEVKLHEKKQGKPVFGVCGNVWNHLHSGIYLAGQCLDELQEYFHYNEAFEKVHSWWKKYHLNDCHAGTPEQEKALAKVGLLGVSQYERACTYLKSIGLYMSPYNGDSHEYGHGWIYYPIPEKDLEEIKMFIKELNAKSVLTAQRKEQNNE